MIDLIINYHSNYQKDAAIDRIIKIIITITYYH